MEQEGLVSVHGTEAAATSAAEKQTLPKDETGESTLPTQ